jgi:four helix bundle protein
MIGNNMEVVMGRKYRDLQVWHKAMDLAEACYRSATQFPKYEQYGLSDQLRRAASSIPANIAEGRARSYAKEFRQFLSIALGSLAELETHIQLSARLRYLPDDQASALLERTEEVGKMLGSLRARLDPDQEKNAASRRLRPINSRRPAAKAPKQ